MDLQRCLDTSTDNWVNITHRLATSIELCTWLFATTPPIVHVRWGVICQFYTCIQSPFRFLSIFYTIIILYVYIDKDIHTHTQYTTLHFIDEHLFPRITAFWSIFAINTRSGCCVTCCRGWRCSVCGVIKIPYWYIAPPRAVIAPPATALL